MTIAGWAAMDEDEPGELVDGRLVEEEVPDYVHEVVVAWLIRVLGGWAAVFTVLMLGVRMPPRRGPISIPPDIAVELVARS